MPKPKEKPTVSNQIYILFTLFAIVLAFGVGFVINISPNFFSQLSQGKLIHTIYKEVPVYVPSGENLFIKEVGIPAISPEGGGILGKVTIIIRKGTGMVLADVGNILVNEDTEHSARKAATYAFEYAGRDLNNYDVIYHLDVDAPAIEGSSAGAAMTVGTIAALMGYELNESVSITGTILHDGSIGPASGLLEKAQAVKDAGKTLFLVPPTQSTIVSSKSEEYCANYGGQEFCSTESKVVQTSIPENVSISVIEVQNISQALNHFVETK